jgi:hypothetical protein
MYESQSLSNNSHEVRSSGALWSLSRKEYDCMKEVKLRQILIHISGYSGI